MFEILSCRQLISSTKCPFGNASVRQNVASATYINDRQNVVSATYINVRQNVGSVVYNSEICLSDIFYETWN
jgi:hypothetical protein